MMKIDDLDNRTYIIGREGNIPLNDKAVSKQHAEIQVLDGKIYLRDLNSTNGTYLVEDNKLIKFTSGYVEPEQRVVLGQKSYSIGELLDMVFAKTVEI